MPPRVMPGDPGRSVEWATAKPGSLLGMAVSVWELSLSSDGVGGAAVVAVEIGRLEVPMRTPDGPREMRVPEIVTAGPPWVRAVPPKEKTAGRCGEGVAVAVTGVYVTPPITIGLESACAGWPLASSDAPLSFSTALLGWSGDFDDFRSPCSG